MNEEAKSSAASEGAAKSIRALKLLEGYEMVVAVWRGEIKVARVT